ncbi:DUF4124 domain-containing protein [Thalassotalea marina]|uniref:DUF4124 domain-containing protein n=1 Tax=Thalassotalea marina TaxID=1673741 RepID=A0A919EI98_9GAMM|nr:DUF4124 domain-containing protein [Thalassotalea marina]GHF82139.1 hypothetical protein GCM10017161_06650 [Thalassotalea marina]
MSNKLIVTVVLFVSFALCGKVFSASTKVYVWVDEKGKVVYSDTPRPGAEVVEVKEKNIISSNIDTSILDIKPKVIEDKFEVEITQPKNSQTIRDNTGSVLVQGRIKPLFKQGHKIQLLLDNSPYGSPQNYALFRLSNVDRGEHTLKFELQDNKGKVIASSSPVTFYMHRTSSIKVN